MFYCDFSDWLESVEHHLPECTAAGLLASHWSISPRSGGRHEAVVRARRRAAELKWSAHTERLTPCSAVRLRKRLRAAKAEGCSGWMQGSVHAEASAHSAALCCRRPGALVVGTTTLLHPAGQQHTLRYFFKPQPPGFTSSKLRNFLTPERLG